MADWLDEIEARARGALNGEWLMADDPLKVIIRLVGQIRDLQQRVGFIEGAVDIEDMPDDYAWAVNELTARKAYSKSEIAALLAEQRRLARSSKR